MPKNRDFTNLYKKLNIKQIKETPRIPESERPSNQCEPADHSMCDFLFEDYEDGKGRLLWKAKLYRLDAEQNEKFRKMLLKDLEEGEKE